MARQNYRVDWDATDGRNGGFQRTVWEILLEMDRFNYQAREERSGSSTLGVEPSEGIRAGQSPCGVGLGAALQLSKKDLAGALWVLRAPETSAVRRMSVQPLRTITAILPGSTWSCLFLRIVLQDALSEVTKITSLLPPLHPSLPPFSAEDEGFVVDDITALFMVKNKVVAEWQRRQRAEVEKKKASNHQSMRMERKERAR